MNPTIGHIDCPLCHFPDAPVRETDAKRPKPYIVCEECGMQLFARQEKAAKALRTKMRPIAAAVAAIETTPVLKPTAAEANEAGAAYAKAAASPTAAKPAAKPGLFAGLGFGKL